MPQRRTGTRRKDNMGIKDWQLAHLLTGDDPEPETFETISWNFIKTWHEFKDSPVIQDWKKENGLTFFERNYQKYL